MEIPHQVQACCFMWNVQESEWIPPKPIDWVKARNFRFRLAIKRTFEAAHKRNSKHDRKVCKLHWVRTRWRKKFGIINFVIYVYSWNKFYSCADAKRSHHIGKWRMGEKKTATTTEKLSCTESIQCHDNLVFRIEMPLMPYSSICYLSFASFSIQVPASMLLCVCFFCLFSCC